MKNTHTDRRTARTQEMLQDAFIKLILEKGFSATRVCDIVDSANLNRGTFYLHYEDKYDLLEQMKQNTLSDISAIVHTEQEERRKKPDAGAVNLTGVFRRLLEYMKANRELMLALFSVDGRDSFRRRLCQVMQDNFEQSYSTGSHGRPDSPVSQYRILYAFSADLGVCESWLAHGCLESVADIAEVLAQIQQITFYQDCLTQLLHQPSETGEGC